MELAYIEWEDASAVDEHVGWVHLADAPKPEMHIFRQVGFVVDCDLEAIVLTEAYNAHSSGTIVAPRTRIPLGMIRRYVPINIKPSLGLR